ncbi:30s ribosomal protein S20 [Mycobacteroides abscessus]|nr:30s ribosomal protein S20 [Mycobacteroides abscessus]
MANIKSQEKRIRTNERARLRNQATKSSLRTAIRGLREAIAEGDKEKAGELLVSTSRKLDKAVTRASSTRTRPPTRSRRSPWL